MAKTMGRPTIFEGPKTQHIHGSLTADGAEAFEVARERLAKIAELPAGKVSDGNTVEYLARGEQKTRNYLKTKKKR